MSPIPTNIKGMAAVKTDKVSDLEIWMGIKEEFYLQTGWITLVGIYD